MRKYFLSSELPANFTELDFRVDSTTNTTLTVSWNTETGENFEEVHLKLQNGTIIKANFSNGQQVIEGLTPGENYQIECFGWRDGVPSKDYTTVTSYTSTPFFKSFFSHIDVFYIHENITINMSSDCFIQKM